MALRWKAYAPNTILKAVEVQDLADNGVVQVDAAADLASADLVNANVTFVTAEHKVYTRVAAGIGADKWKVFSGGLPGLGGWAEITATTGSPTKHEYTDANGNDWTAYEWTGDGTTTTTEGLVDVLLVGAGGERVASSTASMNSGGRSEAGTAGGLVIGVWQVTAGSHPIVVGTVSTPPTPSTSTTFAGVVLPATGGRNAGNGNRGSSALESVNGFGNGAAGYKSSITGTEIEYGRGGYLGSSASDGWTGSDTVPTEMPPTAGTHGWGGSVFPYDSAGGGHGEPATPGVVIIRVPRANAKA